LPEVLEPVRRWLVVIVRVAWLGPSASRTSAAVNVSNDFPNCPHLTIDDAIELLTCHTLLAPDLTQATLGASESYLPHFDRQFGYLHANALRHRPALTRYPVDIL
jgi:hypothetical protein